MTSSCQLLTDAGLPRRFRMKRSATRQTSQHHIARPHRTEVGAAARLKLVMGAHADTACRMFTSRHPQRASPLTVGCPNDTITQCTCLATSGLNSCAETSTSRAPGGHLDLPCIPTPSTLRSADGDHFSRIGTVAASEASRRPESHTHACSGVPRASRSSTLPACPEATGQLPALVKPMRCISVDDTPSQTLQWCFSPVDGPDAAAAALGLLPAERRLSTCRIFEDAAGSPCNILDLQQADGSSGCVSEHDDDDDDRCESWLSTVVSIARSSQREGVEGGGSGDADLDLTLALPALRVPSFCGSDAFSGVSFAGLMSAASGSHSTRCLTRASTFMGCDERSGAPLSASYYSLIETPVASTAGSSPTWSPHATGMFAQLRAAAAIGVSGGSFSQDALPAARPAQRMPASPFARSTYCNSPFERESRDSVEAPAPSSRDGQLGTLSATPPTAASHAATLLRRPTSNSGGLKSAVSAGRSQPLRPWPSPSCSTQRSCGNLSSLSGSTPPRSGSGATLSRPSSGMALRRSVPLHFLSIRETSRCQEPSASAATVPQALRPLYCQEHDSVQLLQCIDSGSQGTVYQGASMAQAPACCCGDTRDDSVGCGT